MNNIIYNSKEDIEDWLFKMKIKKYFIHNDLTIDVFSNVNLSKKLEQPFLPVKFGCIHGDFICNHNKLTSFIGFPNYITGDFKCSDNNIAIIDFFPICNNNIILSNNNLTTMKNFPESVNNLSLYKNKITSMDYCPLFVNGKLNLSKNKIKLLDNLPEKVNSLNLSDNKIEVINKIPKEIKHLFLDNNLITDINIKIPNLNTFSISNNKLSNFKNFPNFVKLHFKFSNNKIFNFDDYITELHDICSVDIKDIKTLNNYYIINKEKFELQQLSKCCNSNNKSNNKNKL